VLPQVFLNSLNIGGNTRVDFFPQPQAFIGVGKEDLLLGPGEGHIKEPPLFREISFLVLFPVRDQPVFTTYNEKDGKLQTLGRCMVIRVTLSAAGSYRSCSFSRAR